METKQINKMTDAEYFALPAISASQLKAYDKGAYYFWKQSPYNPNKEPEKDSDAMMFGKLCHCLLLEPAEFEKSFAVVDFGATRRTKKYEEAKATMPDKVIVSPSELEHAKKMIACIGEHKLASAILNGATAEMPSVWKDETTGLYCKAKIDAIKRTKNGLVVIDYKTAKSIPELLHQAQKSQYILQANFYCEAVKEKYGEYPCEFVFIIQSNIEGEEDVICVANVEQESFDVGKTIMRSHMEGIKEKLDQWNEKHDKTIWAAYPERELIAYSNYYLTNGTY